MPRYSTQSFKHGDTNKIGVLVSNLGTPAAPTTAAVRRYLAEFLADPRVVEMSRWAWWPILHGIILNIRPRRSAHAYAKIWSVEGSPLLSISQQQTAALRERLNTALPARVSVALGMRYGEPSIASALRELRADGVRRLVVLPLYPQYAAATTASLFDAVTTELQGWRWLPELRTLNDYHAHPRYILALANSVREYWATHGRGQRLLLSFHGIPRDYFLAGDPYHCQCHATARLLAAELGLGATEWQLSFQSRFGPRKWLEPYTDASLLALAREGVKQVDVVCPGFAADCLETLEEISIQNDERFRAAGGEALRYIPALNDRPEHIELLAQVALSQMQGWPEADANWNEQEAAAARGDAKARALALGAEA